MIGNPSKLGDWHPVIAKSDVTGVDRFCTLATD